MRIKLYVGDDLAFDNYLPKEEGYGLHSLNVTDGVNKGGTATILLPATHPKRDSFRPYAVPVEIYRDGKLRWRGRPLPLDNEDIYGRKTILCEGELCFLQDAVHRPYAYNGEAADVFGRVLSVYNAAVEPWKRFTVGVVTVKGVADILSNNPENCLEVIQRLVAALGGYILFDTAPDGTRRINWYKDFPYTCNQTVRYGYNLTDYSRKDGLTGFATRIIPYGKADKDGNRLKINIDGKDYVENPDAVAEYGIVEASVTYNDIEDPEELRKQAERDVGIYGMVPSVITMSAIDMSRQDLNLDAFAIGQQVPAESAKHNLSGYYYLTGITEDLVNPNVGGITLQRELASIGSKKEQTLSAAVAVSRKNILAAAGEETDAFLTQEYVFNKLTNYGAIKGVYMLDSELLVNADYIRTGHLSADLIKGGKIVSSGMAYLPPTKEDVNAMLWALNFPDEYPVRDIYDLDGDGRFTSADVLLAYRIFYGRAELSESPHAALSEVTIVIEPSPTSELTRITGKHIGGGEVVVALGICGSKIPLIKGDCAVSGSMSVGGSLATNSLSVDPNGGNPKEIEWRDNGDGTFTLIGKDES